MGAQTAQLAGIILFSSPLDTVFGYEYASKENKSDC